MSKKKRGNLYISIVMMSVVPLLLFGLTVTLFSVGRFRLVMNDEVEKEMDSVAESILVFYDYEYPGSFHVEGDQVLALFKGDTEITGNFEIIDRMQKETGMEISIFYDNIRMLTTICDDNETRMLGTGANASIVKDVMSSKKAVFYDHLFIENKYYYVFYRPILSDSGSCIGMIGIAKSSQEVQESVWLAVLPILVLAGISMLVAAWISLSYAKKLSFSIMKVKESLAKVAAGNLVCDMDYEVTKRNDEIGEIGQSIISMQKALRILIERDTLTDLYNRRYSNTRLKQTIIACRKQGISYNVALGDIDFFKKVNDTYGHEAGDEVLKAVAKTLKKHMPGKGFVSRWGGEEFLVVLEGMDYASAERKMIDILNDIRAIAVNYQEEIIQITMTFGLVRGYPDSMQDRILVDADQLLYQGKTSGRNRLVTQEIDAEINEEMHEEVNEEVIKEIIEESVDEIKEKESDEGTESDESAD